jgi:hypothetical protein
MGMFSGMRDWRDRSAYWRKEARRTMPTFSQAFALQRTQAELQSSTESVRAESKTQ